MGDTSIKVSGYEFIFQAGDIVYIESTIESKKETIEIAATGPMGCLNYDYDGSTKIIVIKGALTTAATTRVSGYSVTTKLAQKQWLESLINGSQSEIELEDDYEGQSVLNSSSPTPPYLGGFTSTKCMAATISFKKVAGDPNRIHYTLTLQVGGA